MFLHIEDRMSIEEVQDRFSECFPFLKVEFYSNPHRKFQPSAKSHQQDKKKRIRDIRQKHDDGVLEIKSWHTVASVEKRLKEYFDLNVQVFCRDANGAWIQTTSSDCLTLYEQGLSCQ